MSRYQREQRGVKIRYTYTKLSPDNPRRIRCISRGVQPAGSGVPAFRRGWDAVTDIGERRPEKAERTGRGH